MPRAAKAPVRSESPARIVTPFPAASIDLPEIEEHVRRRAYELYEQRGRQDGFAEQDWLRAEAEIHAVAAKRSA